jgi:hypothetical protein
MCTLSQSGYSGLTAFYAYVGFLLPTADTHSSRQSKLLSKQVVRICILLHGLLASCQQVLASP